MLRANKEMFRNYSEVVRYVIQTYANGHVIAGTEAALTRYS